MGRGGRGRGRGDHPEEEGEEELYEEEMEVSGHVGLPPHHGSHWFRGRLFLIPSLF